MLLLAFGVLQLAAPARIDAADSATLVARMEERLFRFTMDWRRVVFGKNNPEWRSASDLRGPFNSVPPTGPTGVLKDPSVLEAPKGFCDPEQRIRYDFDQTEMMAHLIRVQKTVWIPLPLSAMPSRIPEVEVPPVGVNARDEKGRMVRATNWSTDTYRILQEMQSAGGGMTKVKLSFCPQLVRSVPDPNLPGSVDADFWGATHDSVVALRRKLLRSLDSASALIPGSGWLIGQRVRYRLDQNEPVEARRAATSCRAETWWCRTLLAYIDYVVGDAAAADSGFRSAREAMSIDTKREWDDVSDLVGNAGRQEYAALTATRQDSIREVLWWLADPLYLEGGNDRRVEHYARKVMIALHRDNEIDFMFDWRESYLGPGLREAITRYGSPMRPSPCRPRCPWIFHRGDTRALMLGSPAAFRYGTPQFHTVPKWSAVVDPFHATAADWDLTPKRDTLQYLDLSWWAPEFFTRRTGAIEPVDHQVAIFRRGKGPILAAAMQWDTMTYIWRPPQRFVAAAIVSKGPAAPLLGGRDTMSLTSMRAIGAAIPEGPSLLSLEMVPLNGAGTAGRARFGIDAPPGLANTTFGSLALSDPVLVRVNPGEAAPPDIRRMLERMYGTTRFVRPSAIGVFWELYGANDNDTLRVSIRVVRRDDSSVADRLIAAFTPFRAREDSVVAGWTEIVSRDSAMIAEAGVTIRPRGVVLNLSNLSPGEYSLEVNAVRGPMLATSRRALVIERPR